MYVRYVRIQLFTPNTMRPSMSFSYMGKTIFEIKSTHVTFSFADYSTFIGVFQMCDRKLEIFQQFNQRFFSTFNANEEMFEEGRYE